MRYAEITLFLTEILTEIILPKSWTETAIRRYRFTGGRQTFTIPNTGGLNFNVRDDGSYYEWRMMKDGQTFKCHIGSVHELSLEQAKEKARESVKGASASMKSAWKRTPGPRNGIQQSSNPANTNATGHRTGP